MDKERGQSYTRQVPLEKLVWFVDEIRADNQDAYREFDEYMRPLVRRWQRIPSGGDDAIVNDTMITIKHGLQVAFQWTPKNTYSDNSQDPEERNPGTFYAYCKTIAINSMRNKIRSEEREAYNRGKITSEQSLNSREDPPLTTTLNEFVNQKYHETLNPFELKILELRTTGLTNRQIQTELGIDRRELKDSISLITSKIQENITSKYHLVATNSFKGTLYESANLQVAARKGKLPAVKVFGTWYTTHELAKEYLYSNSSEAKNHEVHAMQRKGLVPLLDYLNGFEYITFETKVRYHPLLTYGRFQRFIKPNDLQIFKDDHKHNRISDKERYALGVDYQLLGLYSAREYRVLRKYLQRKKLFGIMQNRKIYVKKEEAARILKKES